MSNLVYLVFNLHPQTALEENHLIFLYLKKLSDQYPTNSHDLLTLAFFHLAWWKSYHMYRESFLYPFDSITLYGQVHHYFLTRSVLVHI